MHDELDILREVGSIAAAHGGTVLSEILGKRINLFVPSLDVISCGGVSSKIDVERMGIAVISRLSAGLKGKAIFLLDEANAFKLIGLSYKISEEDKKSDVLTEIGLSTIKEIGNIVTSAYLNAISMMLKRVILALPPTLISGMMNEILSMILSSAGTDDYVFLIEAMFEEPQEKIRGGFYLVLTPEAASDIRQVCKKMLAELGEK